MAIALWVMRRDRVKHPQETERQAEAAAAAQETVRQEEFERHAARARAVVAGPRYESNAEQGTIYKSIPWSTYGVEIANYSASPVLEVVLESVELLSADESIRESWHAQDLALEDMPKQVAAVIAPGKANSPTVPLWPACGRTSTLATACCR